MIKLIYTILIFLLAISLLGFSIKGAFNLNGDLAFQDDYDTKLGSPLESSGSSSRYALTEAIVKNHSFFLTKNQAILASPDTVFVNGQFISIFTPAVSFIGVPFYILGQHFGLPQILAFLPITLLSILNIFLIAGLAQKLGVNRNLSYLSGLIFAFGTNSFAYATSFTQHQLSLFLVLLALLNTLGERTWSKNIFFGFLYGVGLLTDIPNFFLLLPIGLYIFSKHFALMSHKNKLTLKFKTAALGLLIGILPIIFLFGYYNYQTTGSPIKIGQFIGRTIPEEIYGGKLLKYESNKNTALVNSPFQTRLQFGGFYTLLLSEDRSWIYYSPVVLIGILGLYFGFKSKDNQQLSQLILSVILVNIVLYSMFGDPWGGWSFGPRYLIPSAGLLSIGLAVALQRLRKNYLFSFLFLLILFYSLIINTLGAITTTSLPPKVEAIALPEPAPYNYQVNWNFLTGQGSSSLIYNMYLTKILTPKDFLLIYAGVICLILGGIYFFSLELNFSQKLISKNTFLANKVYPLEVKKPRKESKKTKK
jgi:hypothetical protein